MIKNIDYSFNVTTGNEVVTIINWWISLSNSIYISIRLPTFMCWTVWRSKLVYTFHINPKHSHALQWRHNMIASQITSLTNVYSTVYSGADQRKHQSSASLAFVRGIHRGPVNSLHKWPVTRKMFPFDDIIMGKDFRPPPSPQWRQKHAHIIKHIKSDRAWQCKQPGH